MTTPDNSVIVDTLASWLRDRELALFCGAGISMAPPSNLPNWRVLTDTIIQMLGRRVGETSQLQSLAGGENKPYLDLLMERKIRPDVVVEILHDVLGDSVFEALEALKTERINANHHLIASLAKLGLLNCVLTTNFDCLIENACRQQGVPVRVVVSSKEYAEDLGPGNGLTVYKLHGTIDRTETLIASINNIARGLDEDKAFVLTRLFARYRMLFVGYSGNDFAINSDYLFLKRTQNHLKGIIWNLRKGETSAVVSEIIELYGHKSQLLHEDLPDLLEALCQRVGIESSLPVDPSPLHTATVESALVNWSATLSERDACFALGRLYLHSGLWDGALESMKIFYRKVRDETLADNFHDLGLACYYIAHAHERFETFHDSFGRPFDIGPAFTYLQQAELTFRQLGDPLLLGMTYHTKARFMATRNFESAFQYYKMAADRYEAAGNYQYLCELLIDIGNFLSVQKAELAPMAMQYLQRGLEWAQKIGALSQMARAQSALGYILAWENRFDLSLQYLEQALHLARIIDDPVILQPILQRYGTVLSAVQDYKKARQVLTESLEIAQSLGVVSHTVTSLNSLAAVEDMLGEKEPAFEHYKLASSLSGIFQRNIAWNNAQLGMAGILMKRGSLLEAKQLVKEALFECESQQWPNYHLAIDLLRNITTAILAKRYENG